MITTARAKKMAENIFVDGEWKKYREEVCKYEKHKNSMHPLQKKYLEKKLEHEKKRLELVYANPDAQKKILEITTGILRKNEKISKEFSELKSRKQNLSAKINRLHERLTKIKHLLSRSKTNSFYKIVSANGEKNIGKILAETFLPDSKSVPLVAKISDKGLDMPTNWNLLSEVKKDKIEKDVRHLI